MDLEEEPINLPVGQNDGWDRLSGFNRAERLACSNPRYFNFVFQVLLSSGRLIYESRLRNESIIRGSINMSPISRLIRYALERNRHSLSSRVEPNFVHSQHDISLLLIWCFFLLFFAKIAFQQIRLIDAEFLPLFPFRQLFAIDRLSSCRRVSFTV